MESIVFMPLPDLLSEGFIRYPPDTDGHNFGGECLQLV
jgi:hypothetical protein